MKLLCTHVSFKLMKVEQLTVRVGNREKLYEMAADKMCQDSSTISMQDIKQPEEPATDR